MFLLIQEDNRYTTVKMAELTEAQIRVGLFVLGAILGFGVSYYLYGRGRQGRERLSILQLGSGVIFFGYMTFSFIAGDAPSEIVLTAILGIFGGENIGKAVREIKGDDNAKKKN